MMKTFYSNLENKELLIKPLPKEQYPEYENLYPVYRTVSSYKQLLRILRKQYDQPMNYFLSAYDFDMSFQRFHKFNGNLTDDLRLKPSAQRVRYPYNQHCLMDRIFHDFDTNILPMNQKYLNDPNNSLLDKQEYLRDLIERQRLLDRPLQDCMELAEYYKTMGLVPVVLFSGKGLHLYVFFSKIPVQYPDYFLKELSKRLTSLKSLDPLVFEPARKARMIGTVNPKTNLHVIPIDLEMDPEEILESAYKPKGNINIDLDGNDSTKIHALINDYTAQKHAMVEEQRIKQKLQPTRRNVYFKNKDTLTINRPIDSLRLLEFPCFRKMDKNHKTMLLIMSLLSYSNLETVEEIQEAAYIYWEQKGTIIAKSAEGRKAIEKNRNKYTFTRRSMYDLGYCCNCDNQDCWMEKVKFMQEYYDKLDSYHSC